MAEKTTKKKSRSNEELWEVVVKTPGVETVEGIISANLGQSVIVNFKRSGSTKRQKRTISLDKIVFVRGGLKEGESTYICFRSELAPAFRTLRNVSLEDGADKSTGFIMGKNEKGESIMIHPGYADIRTSKNTEVVAPAGSAAVKKKKAK